MTAIETAPRAQAQNGGSMMEEQLLGAAKEGPMVKHMIAAPAPSAQRRRGQRDSGSVRTWLAILTFPFRVLRELYWLLDPDAKVRSRGLQIMGRVVATETTTRTVRGEYGEETITIYHVTYDFVAHGLTHTAQKKVGSLANLGRGAAIRVYYLPETYPLKSAIDWEPGRAKHN